VIKRQKHEADCPPYLAHRLRTSTPLHIQSYTVLKHRLDTGNGTLKRLNGRNKPYSNAKTIWIDFHAGTMYPLLNYTPLDTPWGGRDDKSKESEWYIAFTLERWIRTSDRIGEREKTSYSTPRPMTAKINNIVTSMGLYIYACRDIYIHTYIHTYTHTYIHTHTYIQTHTHTHTYKILIENL
jgi:hypothetical protein